MRNITGVLGISLLLQLVWLGSGCTQDNKDSRMQQDSTLSLVIREWSGKIAKYPENHTFLYGRGQEFAQNKSYKRALEDFDRALAIDATKPEYHIARAEVLMGLNETKEALKSYEKAVEVDPDNEEALLLLGRFHLIVREFDKSIAMLKKLEALAPANVEGLFYQGMNYKEKADTASAIAAFQKAVQVDLFHYNSLIQLGQIYAQQKDPVGLSYFKNATLADEFSDEAYYAMGLLYQDLKQYDSAMVKYQETVNINPRHYFAYYNTGYILFTMENYNRAIEHFQLAIKFAPELVKAQYMLGLCYEGLSNYEQARVHFSDCLTLDPNYKLAKDGLDRLNQYES